MRRSAPFQRRSQPLNQAGDSGTIALAVALAAMATTILCNRDTGPVRAALSPEDG
jgi:hypothetical protein